MNKQDSDVIELIDVATHLGYFGYSVTASKDANDWYRAHSTDTWTFDYTKWRNFVCFRSYLKISKVDETTFKKNLCAVNDAQAGAGISQFHLQEINETEIHAYSWALLPGAYDRKTFGANLMLWTRDMDRLGSFIEHALAA